jgi:Dipeptidyl peptidase IV (DPP IV) N-terminal region
VYSIPYYIPASSTPRPYPEYVDIKYPKPGYPNPIVEVHVSSVWGETWRVDGREGDGWEDQKLVTNVKWMGEGNVLVSETNRVSDHFRAVLVDVPTKSSSVVRDEKVQEGWFEIVPVSCTKVNGSRMRCYSYRGIPNEGDLTTGILTSLTGMGIITWDTSPP